MNRTENLRQHFLEYRKKLDDLLDSVNVNDLEKVITTMITAFKNGNTIFICGNGGSAATSSHMQVDISYFVRHFTQYKPRILSLTDNTPMITAIGNDTSFENIFAHQMKGVFSSGDVVICFSASGNSGNVIKAAQFANENGGSSIAIVGFDGGELKKICTCSLHNANPKGDYGPIEDLHMIYDHIIVTFLSIDPEFLSLQ